MAPRRSRSTRGPMCGSVTFWPYRSSIFDPQDCALFSRRGGRGPARSGGAGESRKGGNRKASPHRRSDPTLLSIVWRLPQNGRMGLNRVGRTRRAPSARRGYSRGAGAPAEQRRRPCQRHQQRRPHHATLLPETEPEGSLIGGSNCAEPTARRGRFGAGAPPGRPRVQITTIGSISLERAHT